MGLPPWATSSSQKFVMVTGANSGLGFGICERLIDEFLSQPERDPGAHLVLIITTRSQGKTRETIARLRKHLRWFAERSEFARELKKVAVLQGQPYTWKEVAARVHFLAVEVDLTNLSNIYEVAQKIQGKAGGIGSPDAPARDGQERSGSKGAGLKSIAIPRLDALIMNAGIGGWSGLNWPKAVWNILSSMPDAVTWPEYKISHVGAVVKKQVLRIAKRNDEDDASSTQRLVDGAGHSEEHKGASNDDDLALGEVFCANIFGHYILGHQLMPLLDNLAGRAAHDRGRLIWVSSIEAQSQPLDEDDIQGLGSLTPYENSKRLTDILALTADLPSVQRSSAPYFAYTNGDGRTGADRERPEIYLTHPGICQTSIMDLPLVLRWAMLAALYIARVLFNSIWHTISAYKGAVAPVWIALAEQSTLDSLEGRVFSSPPSSDSSTVPAKAKWGSSTDRWGNERVRRTEVGGWGWRGTVRDVSGDGRRGRKKGARDLTKEEREEFEILGGRCWATMEELRREWEARVGEGQS